jgi:23S rRNA (guanosine2251-2'-O)-methyltransferase
MGNSAIQSIESTIKWMGWLFNEMCWSGELTRFEVRQCTDQGCGLRIPLDPAAFSGTFCPRCGAKMERVVAPYENQKCGETDLTPKRRISVLLDNIRSAHNVGAIFRTADGVGIRHLYLCGFTPSPDETPAIAKTALGAETHLTWSQHLNGLALAEELHEKGYFLVALECVSKATPIYRFRTEPPSSQPWVLVIGNERAGVDPGLLEICDEVIALPMMGQKTSLNVAVAFGAAAYWLSFA